MRFRSRGCWPNRCRRFVAELDGVRHSLIEMRSPLARATRRTARAALIPDHDGEILFKLAERRTAVTDVGVPGPADWFPLQAAGEGGRRPYMPRSSASACSWVSSEVRVASTSSRASTQLVR